LHQGDGLLERLLLVLIALMTLGAVAIELKTIFNQGTVNLADILLMFLYTEVIAMIAVFYTSSGLAFIYPIFIAITALSRLVVLQGWWFFDTRCTYSALLWCCAARHRAQSMAIH